MRESETTESKKSLAELSEGLVSIAAILNKHGRGELWFGVRNDGCPVGMDVTETTLRKVSQAIAAHIEPKIYPEIDSVTLEAKHCIRIAFSGSEAPYYAHGRAYMRVADEDRQLSAKELEGLILRKNRTREGWDSEAITDPGFQLGIQRLRGFVKRAGLTWSDASSVLENLGLRTAQGYRNATGLFFARTPTLKLRCAVFASPTSPTLIDQHDFVADLPTLIDEAEKYILRNIHIGMRLEGMRRVDVPEIPQPALREAIVNAFCHRDYRDPDEVRIAIYPDRVEIRNPGSLPDGYTIDTLRTHRVSNRRNPLIASLLQRLHLVEAWGRGLSLILDYAPNATFQEVAHLFITTFPRNLNPTQGAESQLESQLESRVGSALKARILAALAHQPLGKRELSEQLGQRVVSGPLHQALRDLIVDEWVVYTLPSKPNSRLQKYQLTEKARTLLGDKVR